MKLFAALAILLFTTSTYASTSGYACTFKQLLAAGADYEKVNDFSFGDYPYLIIHRDGRDIVSVSIGAMEYEASDYEFLLGATKDASTLKILKLADEGFPLYKAITISLPNNSPKSAIVESHGDEVEGLVAEFQGCQ